MGTHFSPILKNGLAILPCVCARHILSLPPDQLMDVTVTDAKVAGEPAAHILRHKPVQTIAISGMEVLDRVVVQVVIMVVGDYYSTKLRWQLINCAGCKNNKTSICLSKKS